MSLTSYRAAPPRGNPLFAGSQIKSGARGHGWGFGEPGGDLLFRRLSGSTIGAEGFHGRVRDGIGCLAPRCGHQAGQAPRQRTEYRRQRTEDNLQKTKATKAESLKDRISEAGLEKTEL
jgi:hypothetical protein